MNLALVTHRFTTGDGQGRVNYEIARHAAAKGCRVTLVASEVADDLREHPLVNWVSVPVAGLPTEMARNLVFARRSASWLRRNRQNFDIVHVNGGITWAAGDVNTAHFVHAAWAKSPVHTARVNRNAYGLYQWAYTRLNSIWEQTAYRRARRVVAVSARVRRELHEVGVSPERSGVILNGVNVDEFHPGAADRDALGLPLAAPLALFAGEIRTPRKNLETVLRAVADVPGLHIAIIGSLAGSPYPAMAERLGVAGRAHFLGYRHDVAELMRAADMFVFPSRYEACSLVLLEALASGLPVITTQTAGGAELISTKAGVVMADPNDVSLLAESLRRITGDCDLRRLMGQAARSIAEKHSWADMADQYLALYGETKPVRL